MDIEAYNHIRSGGAGFYEQRRGLIAVWGKEAVQFLDGMVSNDMKTLEDDEQMPAAFPSAQGRLLAAVRILRQGDRFLIETEEATREKVFNNLFRFTYAGDFFVADQSDQYRYFEMFGISENSPPFEGGVAEFRGRGGSLGLFVEPDQEPPSDAVAIDDETYETLRIESGIPKYGVDMDETTIVPELGLDGLISYNKGCYIGQEIIARIHFRGHVAKRLTGLALDGPRTPSSASVDSEASSISPQAAIADEGVRVPVELTTPDGKPAGRITSLTYSPKLEKTIALAYVRYDYLPEDTKLMVGEVPATVKDLPFLSWNRECKVR